jgi:hypothetical protein
MKHVPARTPQERTLTCRWDRVARRLSLRDDLALLSARLFRTVAQPAGIARLLARPRHMGRTFRGRAAEIGSAPTE